MSSLSQEIVMCLAIKIRQKIYAIRHAVGIQGWILSGVGKKCADGED
jgi:hypothetical protein